MRLTRRKITLFRLLLALILVLFVIILCCYVVVSNRLKQDRASAVKRDTYNTGVRVLYSVHSKSNDSIGYFQSTAFSSLPKENIFPSHRMEMGPQYHHKENSQNHKSTRYNSSVHIVILKTWKDKLVSIKEINIGCDVPCFISGTNTLKALIRSDAVAFTLYRLDLLPSNKIKTSDPNVILKNLGIYTGSIQYYKDWKDGRTVHVQSLSI